MKELSKHYTPAETESKHYQKWLDKKAFKPEYYENDGNKGQYLSMVIPPPNVTGNLHIGHALNNSIQDTIARHSRLKGVPVLWIPGTDHAGIATQNVVEKQLRAKGINKEDLGREKFVEQVWEWKNQSGNTIIEQLKKLGASCDWDRQRFTLDDDYAHEVKEVFVRLYDKGLIYKGEYIVNWCPRCLTALSDIEVNFAPNKAKLWDIIYPLADGSGHIIVSTTRPETLFGDVAVAVHPEDERYTHMHGQKLKLPLTNKEINILVDSFVDKSFGAGAVKITPAHDINDFAVGQRHKLDMPIVMDTKGVLNEQAGEFSGLDRFEARKKVVEKLKEEGLLAKEEDYENSIGRCYRCDTVIEPRLSTQWFMQMTPLAKPALKAVLDDKEIEFIPQRWEKVYQDWLVNIRDWCISRQLWWGHQIPAYYCEECDTEHANPIVALNKPDKCPKCDSTNIIQDSDVLDTWFSSQLWPFATMPDADRAKYFPTSVLVTGFDIIFFWVARMIMSSIELEQKKPFSKVYIHGLVRDIHGKKMSKSVGNVIDPVTLIDKYGADALRYTLISLIGSEGQDIKLSDDKVESSRNFANKIWNAARFIMMQTEGLPEVDIASSNKLTAIDKAMLTKLYEMETSVQKSYDEFDFGVAAGQLYKFIWNELCDWYIEYAKYNKTNTTKTILKHALTQSMLYLHPIMPFLTEEIVENITGKSITDTRYAENSIKYSNKKAEASFDYIQGLVSTIRNLRAEAKVALGAKADINISSENKDELAIISDNQGVIEYFTKTNISIVPSTSDIKGTKGVYNAAEIVLVLSAMDTAAEKERLTKELDRLKGEIERIENKLGNEGFVAKAPPKVIDAEKAKLSNYQTQYESVKDAIKGL